MTSQFVQTVAMKKVQTVINGTLPNNALISVIPDGTGVDIVIGAYYSDRCGSYFTKPSVAKMIGILQEIHDAM